MKGDRITITNSMTNLNTENVLHVYRPQVDSSGNFVCGFDGSVVLENLGGVKTGTTGIIVGDPVKVHKTQLLHLQSQEGASMAGTSDFVLVFPVHLEQYQQVGWLPAEHIKITSGGRA